MAVRYPSLEFRLHMTTQVRFRPHEPTLIMLDPHGALGPIEARDSVRSEYSLVLQVRGGNDNWLRRGRIKAKLPVPSHVLDGQEGAVSQDNHIEVTVADEDTVGCFDDLGENFLDRIGRNVTFALFGTTFTDDDGVDGALGPVDVFGCVHCSFDIGPVEVGVGSSGSLD